MKVRMTIVISLMLLLTAGCGVFDRGGDGEDSATSENHRERDWENRMAIALGGVADGWDEVIVPEEDLTEGGTVDFTTEHPDFLDFEPLDNFASFTLGGGGKVVPQMIGSGTFRYSVNGSRFGPLTLVVTPPQPLIQILLGEAWGQVTNDADLDENGSVPLTSVSLTGEAIAHVIKNRVDLINDDGNPGLFMADDDAYDEEPYRAVIEAEYNGNYQFHPLDPENAMNELYNDAAYRTDLDNGYLVAYDQALLSAADVYSGDAPDPTGGAFAFYSPDEDEYQVIRQALLSGTTTLPVGAGKTDAQFPALAPIQIFVLDDIPVTIKNGEEVPAFVFVRSRNSGAPAVTE